MEILRNFFSPQIGFMQETLNFRYSFGLKNEKINFIEAEKLFFKIKNKSKISRNDSHFPGFEYLQGTFRHHIPT